MCRHILNAKVYFQASCCNNWFDCFECHDEVNDHQFQIARTVKLNCKDCHRVFEKDLGMLLERDKFCENCNVKWCIPGVTPESVVFDEGRDVMEKMLQKVVDEAAKEL